MMIKTTYKSFATSLCLALGLTLTGCNNMVDVPAPDTQPIHSPAIDHSTGDALNGNVKDGNLNNNNEKTSQCKGMDPTRVMCTAQYDPVCVKVKTPTGISYKTAGNSCTACLVPNVISYEPGECDASL